jgi:D-lactate dehydrogenase (cytochrome)
LGSRIEAQAPRGVASAVEPATDPTVVQAYEEDGARVRGRCAGVFRPACEADVAAILARASRERRPVVAQGARSSLTGGATPRDEWVISTERMDRLLDLRVARAGGAARAPPGLRLRTLNERALERARYFPPVPTYDLCCLGGAIATNAAGAVTFKHGAVRGWVRGLRVVLAWGDVIALRRGDVFASTDGAFEVARRDGGVVRVPIPTYRTPGLKKVSCGYYARDGMDLVDLFVGSEGTLGFVTEIEVALAPAPACVVTGLAAVPSDEAALALAAEVRAASERTWLEADRAGPDVRSIELLDAASLDLVRERGHHEGTLPPRGACAVIWEQELPSRLAPDEALEGIRAGLEGRAPGPDPALAALAALGAILARHGAQDDVLLALPDDPKTARAIAALRESVPEAVNDLVAARKRSDPGVKKVATDMCVPFGRLGEWLAATRALLRGRGLDHVAFGHVSDGNLHVNVLARSAAEARAGDEALLEIGDLARTLGGVPLAEHGVGKSPTKQELLRRFYGDEGLLSMARTKRALDPSLVLAPANVIPKDILDRTS